jgi:hypothetical protein
MCSGRFTTNSNSGKRWGGLISLALSHLCGAVAGSLGNNLRRILKARLMCLVTLGKVLEANGMDEKRCSRRSGKGFLMLYS